jgi:hypothetical protein
VKSSSFGVATGCLGHFRQLQRSTLDAERDDSTFQKDSVRLEAARTV